MAHRVTNLLGGALALALGAAGGAWLASGSPASPVLAAQEATAAAPATAPAEAPAGEPAPCCRKGKDGQGSGCNHGAHAAKAGGHDGCPRHKAAAATPKADTSSPSRPKGAAVQAKPTYVCPMHPEVTSDKKEDRCPKCGMFLEPVAQ